MKSKLFVVLPAALSVAILIWLIYPRAHALLDVLKNADLFFLGFCMVFAVSSYSFMGLTLWEVLKLLHYRLPFWETGGIALVSTAANYFFSSGGISGFALRAHLLSKRRIPYGICVTTSVVISVFIYLVLSILILQGMILQLLKTHEFGLRFFESLLGIIFLLGFAFFLVLLFFRHEMRSKWSKKLYHGVNHIIYFFSKKEIPRETFNQFEHQLNRGIHTIHSRKYELPKVIGYVCMDWISTLLILYFAFMAVGINMGTSKLIIGFSFGMAMTVIPVLPGGLGAMEAAMTAVFFQMGISWEKALAASLIYRFFYYLLPAFFAIFIYWGLKISEPEYFCKAQYYKTQGREGVKDKWEG
ncbi:MAG: flippase-like domain-containing protein [Elusimicrobia bacterium]|nr:flippase-like domain-containing protein [Elusimicrobiota bacterium]